MRILESAGKVKGSQRLFPSSHFFLHSEIGPRKLMTNSSGILEESLIGSYLQAKIQKIVVSSQDTPRISALLCHLLGILDASSAGREFSA